MQATDSVVAGVVGSNAKNIGMLFSYWVPFHDNVMGKCDHVSCENLAGPRVKPQNYRFWGHADSLSGTPLCDHIKKMNVVSA